MGRDPRITPNVNRFAVLHQEASCLRDERRNLHNPMPSPRRILLLGRGERPTMVHIFSFAQGDPKNRGGRVELASQFGYQSLGHMDQRPQTTLELQIDSHDLSQVMDFFGVKNPPIVLKMPIQELTPFMGKQQGTHAI